MNEKAEILISTSSVCKYLSLLGQLNESEALFQSAERLQSNDLTRNKKHVERLWHNLRTTFSELSLPIGFGAFSLDNPFILQKIFTLNEQIDLLAHEYGWNISVQKYLQYLIREKWSVEEVWKILENNVIRYERL